MLKEFCKGSDVESIVGVFGEVNRLLKTEGVGTDMDGVEVNSHQSAIDALNSEYKDLKSNFRIKQYTREWAFVDFIKKLGIANDNPKEFAINFWNTDLVNENAQPTEGAITLSKFFHNSGIDVHRITARPSYVRDVTFRWYEREMPWVDPTLIHVQDKGKIIYPRYKIDKINGLRLGFYFEDEPGNAEEIKKETDATVIVVPQYWNEKYLPSDTTRIITTKDYRHAPTALRAYLALAERISN